MFLPEALEEFQALQERHVFYEGQLDDIRQTRRELAKVIRAVDEEITTVFSAAFADVIERASQLPVVVASPASPAAPASIPGAVLRRHHSGSIPPRS